MVYKGNSQQKMDDDWGYPYDLGSLHLGGTGTCPGIGAELPGRRLGRALVPGQHSACGVCHRRISLIF